MRTKILGLALAAALVPCSAPAQTFLGELNSGQVLGNYSGAQTQGAPVNWMMANAGCPGGSTAPNLTAYQIYADTTNAPTATSLNMKIGSACVPIATINESTHLITFVGGAFTLPTTVTSSAGYSVNWTGAAANALQLAGNGNSLTTSLQLNPGLGTLSTGTITELVIERTGFQAFGGNYGRWSFSALGSAQVNETGLIGEFGGTTATGAMGPFVFQNANENPPSTFTVTEFWRVNTTSGGSEDTNLGSMMIGLGSTPINTPVLETLPSAGAGTTDSNRLTFIGHGNNGTTIVGVQWREFANVTSQAGASQFVWQQNLNGGSGAWTTRASLTDAGAFTVASVTVSGIAGSTQCLHVNSAGLISGTGSDCGAGGAGLTVGTTTIASGTSGRMLFDNSGVLGEATITGTLGSVVLSNSPTLVTPTLGVATATSINKVAITAPATSATLTIANSKTFTVSNTIALQGTDSTTFTLPIANDTLAGLGTTQSFSGVNTFSTSTTVQGQLTLNIARSIASATAAALDDVFVQAATSTITGNTGSPITRLAKAGIYRPTLTDASAVTVTDAASLYIDNSPLAAGSVTITNAWALLIGSGSTKLQATTISAALTYGGVTLSNSVTGTGAMVLATSPSLTTPTLGVATATSLNGLTITSSTGTLTIANGKTLTANNSLTLAGTDATTMTFPGSTDTVMGLGAVQIVTGAKTFNKDTLIATAGNGSSSTFKPGGQITAQLTSAGTPANTTKTTLQSFTLPANTLDTNGRGVVVHAFGHFAANANSKTVTIDGAGNVLYTSTALTTSGTNWDIWLRMYRTGSSAQIYVATGIFQNSIPSTAESTAGLTDSATILFAVTGTNGTASANDIVCDGMTMEMLN